ncbi:hypothetical protein [Sulfuricella sp.]|uniref:hypothetical protein n=1 Tax=Sulfuricella sp. TaxID=2099377 RepID=UPI002BD0D389|nr:hypothetical protein [Sulfuricella sp.]HUX65420.1 hypothetical protein [Sulfuricella sp.]
MSSILIRSTILESPEGIRAFFLPAKCGDGGLLGLHHWLSVVIGDTAMSALFGQEAKLTALRVG